MAEEDDSRRAPNPTHKSNEQPKAPSSRPESGKPTSLYSIHNQSGIPFNIPKQNQARPEHHRIPAPPPPPQFHSQITRPSNPTWTTKATHKPLYSSKPDIPKMSSASTNLKNFVDLTANEFGVEADANLHGRELDVYSYLDAAKAQENIKALLEGAFEDEDDKPRTRSRRKKVEEDIDKIAAKLNQVAIGVDKTMDTSTESDRKKGTKLKDGEGDEDEEEVDEDDGTVEGLKVKLLPHQIDGVRWMCDKETGRQKTKGVLPKGGILADDMGLGKTVQAIALILTNPKPSSSEETKDNNSKEGKRKSSRESDRGTLVVAPLALIKQWESEIDSKVEDSHRLHVCVYHGTGRTKLIDNLKRYDVIITTYGTLSSDYSASGEDSSKKVGCFSIRWHRLILDEAHTIKNRNAKATQAACALNAEFRWCLTGTPLQNNLDELQSLIHFLRIKPYDDLAAWRDQITRPLNNGRGGLAVRRLQVYLKAFMKRRTKDVLRQNENFDPSGKVDKGEKLKPSGGFRITEREVISIKAEFTPGELNFYKRLESRTDSRLAQMMGGSKLDYASALVLLLRLRQACNHPDLVKSELVEDKDVLLSNSFSGNQAKGAKSEDLDNVTELFGGLSVINRTCDICRANLSSAEAVNGVSRCGECEANLNVEIIRPQKKKNKKGQRKDALLSPPVARGSEARKVRARKNRRVVEDSDDEEDGEWIIPKHQRSAPISDKAADSGSEDAEGGGESLNLEDSETDEDEDNTDTANSLNFKDEEDTRESNDSDAEETEVDYLSDYEEDGIDVLASTKIRYLMQILRRECHDYKFIVFSVFTTMLDKIEPFLKRERLGFARYDGSMRNDLREASLDRLKHHKKTRILLCSLRAGSLGLNLTAASRVVILEPFWNPFVEEQAIDRVHRLNQTVDVKIYKLTVRETVEERILDLQERKRQLANATLEGKAAAGKLTMRDMMALFGREAEARFGQGSLNLGQKKTRLLGPADDDQVVSSSASGANASDTSFSRSMPPSRFGSRDLTAQKTPPAVERNPVKGLSRADDPVYGRRW